MQKIIDAIKRTERGDLWLRTDGVTPALMGRGWIDQQTDESWAEYFHTETRMLSEQIRRNGYASIFVIGMDASFCMHFRVTREGSTFNAHRLD